MSAAVTATTVATGSRLRVRLATAGAVLISLFIIYVGTSFLVAPESTAAGFGFTEWPHGGAAGFLRIKGNRDVVMGLAPLALLLTGHRRALGWVLLAESFAAFADCFTVLANHGSVVTAFAVHFATALFVVATAVLLLTERGARQR
ncbi:DUF4267 domain-containing protein [Streptomyces sp. TLI_171]|uniref:DUF4267 domain-containing protein n=1 Tax=Streptomyces sp. TLI_171 TaxID=1938859 RepID=UPI000C1945A3|nr:DUF4267 domain-containing protein [Streptomyces sp. TLI_171]RKE18253.1 uncharacterized protein DUF4267 [Streptomyces sp. TLI_171]